MHPFLHTILLHMLSKGEECDIVHLYEWACHFRTFPHFTHALELVLHETLQASDVASEAMKGTTSGTLQHTVRFLRQFSEFPDVVVRCARKTDPALWPGLFSFAGN